MKLFNTISTANRNLSQAKLRTTLTIIAIVIGAFTFTLTSAVGEGLKNYVAQQSALVQTHDTLLASKGDIQAISSNIGAKPTKYDPITSDVGMRYLDAQDIDTIRQTPGVARVLPSIPLTTEYLTSGTQKYKTITDEFLPTMQFATSAGNLQDVGKIDNGLALGYGYIEALGFHSPQNALDKEITLVFKDQLKKVQTHTFVVKAVLANSLILNSQTLINRPMIQTISDWQTSGVGDVAYNYTNITILLKSGLSADQLKAAKDSLKAHDITTTTYQDSIQQATQSLSTVQVALGIFSAIAILAAAFGIVNTLYMAVTERTREVGLFKALGMRSGNVFGLFAVEAALIGLWGSLCGILLALGLGMLLNSSLKETFAGTLPGFEPFVFPVNLFLIVVLGVTGLALLVGTFPAMKAMRQNPVAALRYE